MEFFWFMLLLVVVVGNAMVLLRTAKRPNIPDSVKPKPYRDDEEDDR
ncbi:MAG: hypothetical protein PHE55_06275 [Methylococcaceae bacterium]|nr:hypothetical protein [Methylococcaceae bacterium]